MTLLLPAVTVQPRIVAHMSVTPLLLVSVMEPLFQVYDPVANVIVAPSLALERAELTSEIVLPAVQFHASPLPLQAAWTPEAQQSRMSKTIPSLYKEISFSCRMLSTLADFPKEDANLCNGTLHHSEASVQNRPAIYYIVSRFLKLFTLNMFV